MKFRELLDSLRKYCRLLRHSALQSVSEPTTSITSIFKVQISQARNQRAECVLVTTWRSPKEMATFIQIFIQFFIFYMCCILFLCASLSYLCALTFMQYERSVAVCQSTTTKCKPNDTSHLRLQLQNVHIPTCDSIAHRHLSSLISIPS
jgi:hypothetical protein